MARTGRPRTPDPIKKLEGTFRPDRAVDVKVDAQPLAESPPDCLEDEGRAEWARLVPILNRLGVTTELDFACVLCYCISFGMVLRVANRMKGQSLTVGPGKKRAELAILKEHEVLMRTYLGELGLTPATRSRVLTGESGGGGSDELDALIKENQHVH